MSILSKRIVDNLLRRVSGSSFRSDFPRLIVNLGEGDGISDQLRDQLLDSIQRQFARVETIGSSPPPRNISVDGNTHATIVGKADASQCWSEIQYLEKSAGDLFISLEAGTAPNSAVMHIHPAIDDARASRFPFERCASLELTNATIAASAPLICASLLALSPAPRPNSDCLDDELQERIKHCADELESKLKGSLTQSEFDEQTTTYHTYATCLHWLGANSRQVELLVEATRYYHVSLNPLSRNTTPLLWATIQNGLGVALCNIDQLASSQKRLRQAIEAFKNGLKAVPGRRALHLKSALYGNLGQAYVRLHRHSSEPAILERAIEAFESALKIQPRNQATARWASICGGLGTALCQLGMVTKDRSKLVESVNSFRTALNVQSRVGSSTASTATLINLGRSLCGVGALQSDTYRLLEGTEVLRRASQDIDRQCDPDLWLDIQDSIGSALLIAGRRERKAEYLYESIAALSASLSNRDRNQQPVDWSRAQVKIGRAYHLLGKLLGANDSDADREGAKRFLQMAEQACSKARDTYEHLGAAEQASQMSSQIDKIRHTLEWVSDTNNSPTN